MPEHPSLLPPAASLDAIVGLAAHLERDPRFIVRDIYAHGLKPFIEVTDTVNNLVVAFTSEAEYVLYLDVILHDRTGGVRYA